MTETQTEVVLFDSVATDCGCQIGIVTLNDPKALNALSVDMCKLIAKKLTEWHTNENVVAILLKGAGEKAFCAGGNIRKLYESMLDNPPLPNPYAVDFFSNEYRLYRQMHFYPKPIILWGNGIVMGGGLGLTAMCSHRIVTETTRIAMPEITIGLYPDATGSFFLQRMPAKVGLFLGLTGANCNAADALLVNLAEYAVASNEYDNVIEQLVKANWKDNTAHLHEVASRALSNIHHTEHLAESHLASRWQIIQTLMNKGSVHDIDAVLQSAEFAEQHAEDKWLTKAIDTYKHGCPVSAGLTFEIFERANKLSLEQVLYMEMNASLHCANNPDFREGVRALLIDKDRNPQWSKTLDKCDIAYIESHLANPFGEGQHPFQSWLNDDSLSAKLAEDKL